MQHVERPLGEDGADCLMRKTRATAAIVSAQAAVHPCVRPRNTHRSTRYVLCMLQSTQLNRGYGRHRHAGPRDSLTR
eukprot:6189505-Pleurochrysis_carterae.AAC.5